MKQLLLITLITVFCMQSVQAQLSFAKSDREAGVNLGFASYLGDLQPKDYTYSQIGRSMGLHLRQNLSNRLSIKLFANSMRIQARDAASSDKDRFRRNLSFRSDIFEIGLVGEVSLFKFNKYKGNEESYTGLSNVTPYIFGGFNYFHFNPKALYQNEWIALQPLTTEGVSYSRSQIALPFGFGLKYQASQKVIIGLELGSRLTFTDYLDDVSDKYPDFIKLKADKGQVAVDMSFKGDEINVNPRTDLPIAGSKRGNPNNNDWYLTTQFTMAYKLFSKK